MNPGAPPSVAVIGAGPAGLAAAIQLRRQGFEPLVFEAGAAGGLLRNADRVENYPGFPEGISGPDLAGRIVEQASRTGVHIRSEEVLRLAWTRRAFELETPSDRYRADFAVVASGTKPKRLGRPPLTARASARVLYEIAPIWSVARETIVIIGAGDAAFDYALHLARRNKVLLLARGRGARCLPLLRERAARVKSLRCLEEAAVGSIDLTGDGRFRIAVRAAGGKTMLLSADHVVGAIGRSPRTDFLGRAGTMPRAVLEKRGRLHFAGDVRNGRERQAAIAAGDGLRAAMRIARLAREARR